MQKAIHKVLILGTILWLCVLSVAVITLQTYPKPKIGFIDSQLLVTNQAQKIGALYPNGKLPPEKLQLLAMQIKDSVARYAKDHNLILLAKGAVWGGAVDYTSNIIDALKSE